MVFGYHTGPHSRTAAKPVLSYCVVGVQNHAQETANVAELEYVVHNYANVKVAVLTMKIIKSISVAYLNTRY